VTFLEVLVCAALVAVASFMSAAEIALFSLSRFQLRSLKERFRSSHRKIKRLLSDPGGLLITVLVVNEVVNITLSAVIAEIVARRWETSGGHIMRSIFPHAPEWSLQMTVGILITTPVVLIFCEITPKAIAARANQVTSLLSAGPLSIVYDLLKPVRAVLKNVLRLVSRWSGGKAGGEFDQAEGHSEEKPLLREEEFLSMVEEGHREGAIQQTEMELIRNVFDLDDTTVADVCTPISQVHALSVSMSIEGALAEMRGRRYSRIPVFEGSKRRIVGVLFAKDLILAKLEPDVAGASIGALMRKPFVVSPTMRLNQLFRRMKLQKTHLAVIENSPGDAFGVVTMSDVLDALFEDLFSEEETAPPAAGGKP
jgi:putative hemolysin